jgi:hypothetical protein
VTASTSSLRLTCRLAAPADRALMQKSGDRARADLSAGERGQPLR